jgi:hypothetical protein
MTTTTDCLNERGSGRFDQDTMIAQVFTDVTTCG